MTNKRKERVQREFDKIENSIITIIKLIGNNKVNNLYYENIEEDLTAIKNYINQVIYKIIKKS